MTIELQDLLGEGETLADVGGSLVGVDLGALTSPLVLGPPLAGVSGSNYQGMPGSGSNGATALSDEHAVPFWVEEDCTLETVAVWVVTGGAGNACRFGLRSDAGGAAPYPGALLNDFGTSVTTASGALASKSGLAVALTGRTIYWATFTLQGGTAAVLTCFSAVPWSQVQESIAAANAFNRAAGYKQTGVTGALGAFSSTVDAVKTIATPKPVFRFQ